MHSDMPLIFPYSWLGSKLYEVPLESFIQFQWRPRPASLLNEIDAKEIKKNMKSYTRDFEIKDRISQSKASKVSFKIQNILIKKSSKASVYLVRDVVIVLSRWLKSCGW